MGRLRPAYTFPCKKEAPEGIRQTTKRIASRARPILASLSMGILTVADNTVALYALHAGRPGSPFRHWEGALGRRCHLDLAFTKTFPCACTNGSGTVSAGSSSDGAWVSASPTGWKTACSIWCAAPCWGWWRPMTRRPSPPTPWRGRWSCSTSCRDGHRLGHDGGHRPVHRCRRLCANQILGT